MLITGLKIDTGILLSFVVSSSYDFSKRDVNNLSLRLNNLNILWSILLSKRNFFIGGISESVIEIIKFDRSFVNRADRFKLTK